MAVAQSEGEGTRRRDPLSAFFPIMRLVAPSMYYLTFILAGTIIVFVSLLALGLWILTTRIQLPFPYGPTVMYLVSVAVTIFLLVSVWYIWREFRKARLDWLHLWFAVSEPELYVAVDEDLTAMLRGERDE